MFTPAILSQVGVFDEDFGAYGEDLDLSLRAVRQGFQIRHIPEAVVTHQLGATYGRHSARKIFLVERNRTRAAIRSLPLAAIALLPATSAIRLATMGAAAMTGSGLGAGAGLNGAAAALAGMAAGAAQAHRAWGKRRRDQSEWTAGERAMWQHIAKERAPFSDLFGPSISAP